MIKKLSVKRVSSYLPAHTLAHVLIASVFVLTVIPVIPSAYSKAQASNKLESHALQNNPDISINRQNELTYMVRQDCGSCHGMTLKGGLGPSLLAERISVFPTQYLIDAVSHGRQGTPMPPWHSLLTQAEIRWIVEQLQAGTLGHVRNNK